MVFDVEYEIPDTGVNIDNLDAYEEGEYINVEVNIDNNQWTRVVDLKLHLRDLRTSEEILTIDLGLMGIRGGYNKYKSFLLKLDEYPLYLLINRDLKAELIVCDSHNEDILATMSINLPVNNPPEET